MAGVEGVGRRMSLYTTESEQDLSVERAAERRFSMQENVSSDLSSKSVTPLSQTDASLSQRQYSSKRVQSISDHVEYFEKPIHINLGEGNPPINVSLDGAETKKSRPATPEDLVFDIEEEPQEEEPPTEIEVEKNSPRMPVSKSGYRFVDGQLIRINPSRTDRIQAQDMVRLVKQMNNYPATCKNCEEIHLNRENDTLYVQGIRRGKGINNIVAFTVPDEEPTTPSEKRPPSFSMHEKEMVYYGLALQLLSPYAPPPMESTAHYELRYRATFDSKETDCDVLLRDVCGLPQEKVVLEPKNTWQKIGRLVKRIVDTFRKKLAQRAFNKMNRKNLENAIADLSGNGEIESRRNCKEVGDCKSFMREKDGVFELLIQRNTQWYRSNTNLENRYEYSPCSAEDVENAIKEGDWIGYSSKSSAT